MPDWNIYRIWLELFSFRLRGGNERVRFSVTIPFRLRSALTGFSPLNELKVFLIELTRLTLRTDTGAERSRGKGDSRREVEL